MKAFIKILFIILIKQISMLNNSIPNITIKIEGEGYKKYINPDFIPFIEEVYINQNLQDNINNTYYFNETENIIELILNDQNLTSFDNMFNGCKSILYINFTNFDTSKITSMSKMFNSCSNLKELDLSTFNTSNVIQMDSMFQDCSKLSTINLSNFDTAKVERMDSLFSGCSSLVSLDITNFKTNNVKNMEGMFKKCSLLNSLNLLQFDTSKVTTFSEIFYECSQLIILNISHFNTSQVKSMHSMFEKCSSLTSLDLLHFDTSQLERTSNMFYDCVSLELLNLPNFNESKIQNIHYMFYGCRALKSLDLSNFKTSRAKSMNSLFKHCSSLISLNLSNFNFSKVEKTSGMFYGCTNLVSINLPQFFNTPKIDSMHSMFYGCSSLESIDLSNFDTSQVTLMFNMFYGCSNLTSLKMPNFNTPKLEKINSMFYNCSSLISIDLSKINSSKVSNLSNVFYGCSSLKDIDLSNLDTSNATYIQNMFSGCSNLTSLDLSSFNTSKVKQMENLFLNCSSLTSLDLSNFDTSNVITMHKMFSGCSNLTSLDLSNFDTSQVTSMFSLFEECASLKYLNISNFNTSKVKIMKNMFYNCSSLESLDLSNFDTSLMNNTYQMFYDCKSLKSLDLSNFNTSNVINMNEMFYGCKSLEFLDISNFNALNVKNMSYMFYDCLSLVTLNLSNFNISKVGNKNNMISYCESLILLDIFDIESAKNIIKNCSNLEYINIKNYQEKENNKDEIKNILTEAQKNAVICLNNISAQINLDNCNIIDCGIDWRKNRKKLYNGTCFNNCYETNYKFEYNGKCYNECPYETRTVHYYENLCENISPKEYPFLLVHQRENASKCSINDIINKRCVLHNNNTDYYYNSSLMLNNILNDIKNNNDIQNLVNKDQNITIEEYPVKFILKKFNYNNNERRLNILNNESEYDSFLLIIDFLENNKNIRKRIYDAFNIKNGELNHLDLKYYENLFDKKEIMNCSNYSIESLINDQCISCKEGYYSMNNTLSENNNDFINCYSYNDSNENMLSDFSTNIEISNSLDINGENTSDIISSNISDIISSNISDIFSSDKERKESDKISDEYTSDISTEIDLNKYDTILEVNITEIIYYNETRCYNSCEKCDKYGNDSEHYCLECKPDFVYEINKNNYINCYKSCPENITNCPIIPRCKNIDYKLIPEINQCIKDCSESNLYKYEYNNSCYEKCPNGTKTKKNKYYCEKACSEDYPYEEIHTKQCISNCSVNEMFTGICKINNENITTKANLSSKIIDEILNNNLNELLEQVLNNKTDIIITEESKIHQITSLNNQMGKMNLSSIKFGDCENLLRAEYKINETEELIIYKVEHIIDGLNIPIIEYVLFTQDGSQRLNLSICDNIKVQYNIPVSINENEEYKYDPTSDFYNDECNKYSTDGNIDLTLYDRKNQFNNNNMSLCESGCTYIGYNSTSKKALCNCNIKKDMDFSQNDNSDNLVNKIDSDKSNSNLRVTQCFNVLSSSDQIKSNSGFYVTILLLAVFIIVFIMFCTKGRNNLENQINEVIDKKFKNKKNNHDNNKIRTIKSLKFSGKKKKKLINKEIHHIKINSNNSLNESKKLKNSSQINLAKTKTQGNEENTIYIKQAFFDEIPDTENDYEVNNLLYEQALKYDKRTGCDYYCSLIKNKQLIVFTFCSFNDYNSGIIKKFIFFLSFALHYTINALFFNDSNMHQIYEDQGEFNFSYQFPKILISAISSTVILRIILQTLVLTDKSVLNIKQQSTYAMAEQMKYKTLKCMNIKYIIFFILNFILIILFGYYLTCFSAIYENTQIYLIENTFISFGISLFYPFIINIIPTVLRLYSLDRVKKDKIYLYRVSQIVQIL